MSSKPPSPSSHVEGNSIFNAPLFFLSVPLFGLWFYLFFPSRLKSREEVRQVFTAHALIWIYFFFTQLFLYLSIWVVPYFIEPVIMVVIRLNTVFSAFLFGWLMVKSTWAGGWGDEFLRYRILPLMRNWFFAD